MKSPKFGALSGLPVVVTMATMGLTMASHRAVVGHGLRSQLPLLPLVGARAATTVVLASPPFR
jgi:hypothetical protein